MDITVFIKELKRSNFEEVRNDSADFFEGVVTKAELVKVTPVLEKYFGQPVSSLNNLSEKENAHIKSMGGIMGGQMLYLKSEGEKMFFVMLWPWSGGSPITLKTGVK